jgi:hypothetical protein
MPRNNKPNPIVGTTTPIFVPRGSDPKPIRSDQDYFVVQIHGAQAAFTGSIWEHAENLIVATKVSLHHPILGNENLQAIQRTRKVERNRAEQLGLRPNLISLIPAVMPDFSISIDFILNQKNYLRDLGGLINSDAFLATISLAPGAAMVAKTISGLAGKIIETFVPAEERQPILQFSGEFNLSGESFLDGYYVILGASDDQNPLPNPMPKLTVQDGGLLANGKRVTQFSYVIMDVRRIPVRTRAFSDGATWETKLREAEDEARRIGNDPLSSEDENKSAWEKCRNLLKEAQILLRNDSNYLRLEAENIIKGVFSQCARDLNIRSDNQGTGVIVKASRGSNWQPDMQKERALLEIPLGENLDISRNSYATLVAETEQMIRETRLQL